MKYFRTGLISVLMITLMVSPVFAGNNKNNTNSQPPRFPSCEDMHRNGDHAHYSYGQHAVPGYNSLITGSDDVYSLGNGNYLQCLCPVQGQGIQTNWWKVDYLSWDTIMNWTTKGWIYEWGSGWNLDNEKYLAKNSTFSCHNNHHDDNDEDDHHNPPVCSPTVTPTSTPTAQPTVTPTPTPDEEGGNNGDTPTPTPTATIDESETTPTPTQESQVTPTVTVTPEPTRQPEIGGSVESAVVTITASAPVCTDMVLAAPIITSVKRINPTTVEVTWTSVQEAQYYVLSYGLESGNYIYGVTNTGNVTAFQVGSLDPRADYYFQVRAQRGCMPGDPSNELSTKPLAIGGLPYTAGADMSNWLLFGMMSIGGWLMRKTYE